MPKKQQKAKAKAKPRGKKKATKSGAQRATARKQMREASLEDMVGKFARSGLLREAAQRAIRAQLKSGLTAVYKRGSMIIREFPDGRTETVQTTTFTTPRRRLGSSRVTSTRG